MTDLDDLIRRAWPVLLEAVRMGRTVTYTELAGRGGPPLNRRHLHRQLLIPLSERCRRAGLPDLAALVVRKDTGMPGGGWHAPEPGGRPGPGLGRGPRTLPPASAWPRAVPAALLGDRARAG